MADNFFITAILVSHDGATWLPESIAAISAQTRSVDRMVAVDTGSIDNSVKMLTGAGITVIKTDRDAGFGDAIALALGSAKKLKSEEQEELIWILHDDCAPTRTALQFLIDGLTDKPQVAFVGPKLRGWYDRRHLLEVGISIAVNGARWTGLDPREQDQGQFDQPTEVMAVSTAAMLARRRIFEDLGGLDPNLALFRDDVDLGWRARVAGFSVMTAPEALVYHAEASATERRSVDVEEAFLHRPRLLDRKNAAYVLLANASWWLLPWIAIQIVGSAAIRAIGFLFAKLPGYAADEIAAVGLLIIKPRDLLVARKLRKQKRLLSPRIIRQFIPPPGSQIRLALEQARYSLSKFFKADGLDENPDDPMSYADIGVIDESFDDQDLVIAPRKSNWQSLKNRPLLVGLLSTFIISLIASRNRFGSITGGALPMPPSGAMDLIAKYSESWHLVGLGSAASTPPWVAILAAASTVTFGKTWLFLTLFFLLVPTLAFLAVYRSAKRVGISLRLSVIGGVLYAMSPVIWTSINQGRIGTLVVALLAPSFLSVLPRSTNFEALTWRRTYALILLAAFLSAFSTFFLIIWTGFFAMRLGIEIYQRRLEISESNLIKFMMSANLARAKRITAFFLIPGLLNAPWSTSIILHPTQILQDPGLPLTGGSLINILTLNPGGLSGVPGWILSPFLIFLIAITISGKFPLQSAIAISMLGLSVLLSQITVVGHGSIGTVWTGTLIVFIELVVLIPILQTASDLIPNLRSSRVGYGHLLSAVTVLVAIFSLSITSFWAMTGGANSLVSSGKREVVPAFISSLSDTPARPKTLVIGRTGDELKYFVSRGNDLEIGDPDVAVATPTPVRNAITDLVSGTGLTSSKILGDFGIQYLFLKNPVDQGVARTIDGIGGFTRSSATNSGIIWQIVGSKPRVSIQDVSGAITQINSTKVGAIGEITTPGTITLAEKFDTGWKLIVNGNQVKVSESELGLPTFVVSEVGAITLLHDGTKHRALISAQLIALLTVVVLSLPAGRRRREVPVEELA
ncbi:Glycosyltransferase like family 2 [actinobacterium SCGC AAA044-D11]